jgi:hypothetical protein
MSGYDESYDDDSRAAQRAVAAARLHEQQSWRDLQAMRAIERGEHGPAPDHETELDPEWWAARLAERDRDAVIPPALAMLREDADPDAAPDAEDAVPVPRTEPAAPAKPRHWWNRR